MKEGLEKIESKIEVATTGDWNLLKDIKLVALREESEVFGGSLADMEKRSKKDWIQEINKKTKIYVLAKFDSSDYGAKSMASAEYVKEDLGEKEEKFVWVISDVYTRPDFRRQGLSEKVLLKLFDVIKNRGGGELQLIVENTKYKDSVKELYLKLGFSLEIENQDGWIFGKNL